MDGSVTLKVSINFCASAGSFGLNLLSISLKVLYRELTVMHSSCFRKPCLSISTLVCAKSAFLSGCFCAVVAESTIGAAGTTNAEADQSICFTGCGGGGEVMGSAFAFMDFLMSIMDSQFTKLLFYFEYDVCLRGV